MCRGQSRRASGEPKKESNRNRRLRRQHSKSKSGKCNVQWSIFSSSLSEVQLGRSHSLPCFFLKRSKIDISRNVKCLSEYFYRSRSNQDPSPVGADHAEALEIGATFPETRGKRGGGESNPRLVSLFHRLGSSSTASRPYRES